MLPVRSIFSEFPHWALTDSALGDEAVGSMAELHDRRFSSFEEAEKELHALAVQCGFAAIVLRRQEKDPDIGNKFIRTDWECSKGRVRKSKTTGKRDTPIGRCGCQWHAYVRFYKSVQAWIVKIKNDEHNHPGLEGKRLPSNRRHQRQLEDVDERLGNLIKIRKLAGEDIARQLREEFPDSGVIAKDVQNRRLAEKTELYRGRTPTQQFFLELKEQEQRGEAYLRYHTEGGRSDGPLQYVFWTYRWNLEMWKENWEMVSIDDTYKTNRFNMPLAQITGVTGVNTTFNIAWALLLNERTESHSWMLRQLRTLADGAMGVSAIQEPLVIISDFDSSFRAACHTIYPATTTQICIWHVMKNVAYHVRMKWHGSLEGTELGRAMAPRGGRRREEAHQQEDAVAAAEGMANRLAEGLDRHLLGGGEPRRLEAPIPPQEGQPQPGRKYANDADSMLRAWKDTVYASSEGDFNQLWETVQREFVDQRGM